MDIGWPAAVHGMADGGMLGQLVLQIHHGFGAADKEDGISVVQAPYLVRGEQLFATMSSDEFKKRQTLSKKFIFNSVCLFVQYVLYMNFL